MGLEESRGAIVRTKMSEMGTPASWRNARWARGVARICPQRRWRQEAQELAHSLRHRIRGLPSNCRGPGLAYAGMIRSLVRFVPAPTVRPVARQVVALVV